MHALLLIPFLACAAADDGTPSSEVISRALEIAGLGHSFVVYEPVDLLNIRVRSFRNPGGVDRGSDDGSDPGFTGELERCWRQYVAALDAARINIARAMTPEGGGLHLPEPGSEGAKRVSVGIGEIDAAGQRLVADSCLPESARHALLRRAVVRIHSDGRYRHEPFFSCTSIDAGLDLETATAGPAKELRERLMSDEESRARLEEAFRRFAIAATEHRRSALAAWRATTVGDGKAVDSVNADERARAAKRALQVPRTWWREQQTLMDQVQAIATDSGAAAAARSWRIAIARESFPRFVPAIDLEGTLRAAGIDPGTIEAEGWGTFWLGYLTDRDAAVMMLVDRGLAMAESQRRRASSRDSDGGVTPLRARIDAVTKSGDQLARLETTAATRAAELLGESHPESIAPVIEYLGKIGKRPWSAWRVAVDMAEAQAAALETPSAPPEDAETPEEDRPHQPLPQDPNGSAR